jgi:putative ABC transport system substrate-binding protein
VKRRQFITLIGGAAASSVSWPLAPRPAQGQTSTKRLIGNLAAASPASAAPQYQAMLDGLRDLGYVESRDYEIVSKWAYGAMERLPALAAEMISLKPDIILANPTPAVAAAKALTGSIPIVSFMLADEVRLGLVESIARPGSNVTGLSMRVAGMAGKQIELATQTVIGATRIGVLSNAGSADAPTQRQEAEAASAALGLTNLTAEVRTAEEIDTAFQAFEREQTQAVVVLYDALFFQERKRIAALAAERSLPAIYAARDHVLDGGLISYGVSLRASARYHATYIDKILKGAKPANLPIEFPTQLDLVINLKTAKTLGLNVPPTLLALADEVIE